MRTMGTNSCLTKRPHGSAVTTKKLKNEKFKKNEVNSNQFKNFYPIFKIPITL